MKRIFISLAIVLLSGCVSFTSSNTKAPEVQSFEGAQKPTVLANIYLYPTSNGVADAEKELELRRSLGNIMQYSFYKANSFGEVSNNVSNPDYVVEVILKNVYSDCKYCNYATYGTLFIIPSWTNDKYHYQVRITNNATGRTSNFYYYEDIVEVKQLLLVFGMPFALNTVTDMHERVFDAVAFETSRAK